MSQDPWCRRSAQGGWEWGSLGGSAHCPKVQDSTSHVCVPGQEWRQRPGRCALSVKSSAPAWESAGAASGTCAELCPGHRLVLLGLWSHTAPPKPPRAHRSGSLGV